MQGKIIGVGFHKTGTSTLREALKILGYRVKDATPRALLPILRGRYDKVLRMINKYDAVEDTPWFNIYRELDNLIPGSKFILTIRDEESWYTSVSYHIGKLRAAHHEWIYGKGKGLPAEDKQHAISVYRNHNQGVMEYFKERPGDLLVLDFTKGNKWDMLCGFLGREVPEQPFPHYNKTLVSEKNRSNMRNKFRYCKHMVKNRIKIWYIGVLKLDRH
ncbi:MAG: hypothetical protein K9J30_11680 [Bacteroidales bacterium]|nr:hypothetical protein [Bacteroidales bacterium]